MRADRWLSGASRGSVRRAADGLAGLMESTRRLALERNGLLAEVGAGQPAMKAWMHLPPHDARDARSGYRWYYHCHPREARLPGEHGHFHLFSESACGSEVTHLLGVSVTDRGLPLGLFATNRWVTGERWQAAPRVIRRIEAFAMVSPRPLRRVNEWLACLLRAFAPQVRSLLRLRDERLATLRSTVGPNVLEDRRIAVLSRCRIDLFAHAAALDRRQSTDVGTRGRTR